MVYFRYVGDKQKEKYPAASEDANKDQNYNERRKSNFARWTQFKLHQRKHPHQEETERCLIG